MCLILEKPFHDLYVVYAIIPNQNKRTIMLKTLVRTF
jgi:hypothetical protein